MKTFILLTILSLSTVSGTFAVLTRSPKRMVLFWLVTGLLQSGFFILVGFEFLGIVNVLFTVAGATMLQLYSALFGTRDTRNAEGVSTRRDWIQGVGATITLGAVLVFAFSEIPGFEKLGEDLDASRFGSFLLEKFPELPLVLGFVLFLSIVCAATVGRPAWKKVGKDA
ncbi:MAG: NADH-quinone oxidoreductase subunit J [Cryobacterium sp.]|nr:NADH-quinone oxidoreductase subunit J [Oligoflexia bacterium]